MIQCVLVIRWILDFELIKLWYIYPPWLQSFCYILYIPSVVVHYKQQNREYEKQHITVIKYFKIIHYTISTPQGIYTPGKYIK